MVSRFRAIKSQGQSHPSFSLRSRHALKGNDAIHSSRAAEANTSLSIDTVQQDCVHPFHLVNTRIRQSVFRPDLCGQLTITA